MSPAAAGALAWGGLLLIGPIVAIVLRTRMRRRLGNPPAVARLWRELDVQHLPFAVFAIFLIAGILGFMTGDVIVTLTRIRPTFPPTRFYYSLVLGCLIVGAIASLAVIGVAGLRETTPGCRPRSKRTLRSCFLALRYKRVLGMFATGGAGFLAPPLFFSSLLVFGLLEIFVSGVLLKMRPRFAASREFVDSLSFACWEAFLWSFYVIGAINASLMIRNRRLLRSLLARNLFTISSTLGEPVFADMNPASDVFQLSLSLAELVGGTNHRENERSIPTASDLAAKLDIEVGRLPAARKELLNAYSLSRKVLDILPPPASPDRSS